MGLLRLQRTKPVAKHGSTAHREPLCGTCQLCSGCAWPETLHTANRSRAHLLEAPFDSRKGIHIIVHGTVLATCDVYLLIDFHILGVDQTLALTMNRYHLPLSYRAGCKFGLLYNVLLCVLVSVLVARRQFEEAHSVSLDSMMRCAALDQI